MSELERLRRADEIVQSALACADGRLAALLEETCGGDELLRGEVESLLGYRARAKGFLETPAIALSAELFAAAHCSDPEHDGEADLPVGTRIGPYEIVRAIGRGGMGTVYLARRADEEFRKFVALKVVRPGLDTADILRRFRNERQILAALDHPNIARLLDGGKTEAGAPYLVMEYVEGVAVTDYCDRNRLGTEERLRLFIEVCAAVQHAHQNLVVHRDLKPSNILVVEGGGAREATPKLLDFGIAKVLNPELSALAMERTRTELRVLTPDYASPEQLRGERVTTASDIYSLGVVLYELLTGRRPYRVRSTSPRELERVIGEREPVRPSATVVRTRRDRRGETEQDSATPESVSRARDTQPERLRRRLAGDLDNIVLMAMRKEPARRYASVAQLAEDIRRHLEGLPVLARKDTLRYRAGKFVGRHKLGVAAAALVLLSLVAGVVAAAWEARLAAREASVAARERDRARVEQAKAERINAFMQEMLTYADPSWYSPGAGRGGEVKVIDALNEAAGRIDTELADEPEVRAELHHTVGNTYLALRRDDLAEQHLRAALELSRRLYGERHPQIARDLYYLGAALQQNGDLASAESLFRQAVAMMRAVDAENVNLPYMIQDFGGLLTLRGDTADAEPLLRESLEMFRRRYGDEHLTVSVGFERLCQMYETRGDLEQAEAMCAEAARRQRRLANPQVLHSTLSVLGEIKMMQGRYAEAEADLRESVELDRRFLGATHPAVGDDLSQLGDIELHKGDYGAAEEAYRGALEIFGRAFPKDSPSTGWTLAELSLTLIRAGKTARAEPYLREALAAYRSAPEKFARYDNTTGALGESLTLLGRYAEAEPLLVESYNTLNTALGPQAPKTREARRRLAALYLSWGRPDEAARYNAR